MSLRKHGTGEVLSDPPLDTPIEKQGAVQPDWSDKDSVELAAENAAADDEG